MLHTSTVDSNTISVLKELLALPILKDFTLKEIIENHQKKYPNQMLLISIPQALVFFEDAEKSENPIIPKSPYRSAMRTWITPSTLSY